MDLVSMLQKALLQHHVSLDPVAISTEPASDFSQDATIRFVSRFLLDDNDDEDEMQTTESSNHSLDEILMELSEIISTPCDSPQGSSNSLQSSSDYIESPQTGEDLQFSDFLQTQDVHTLLIECAQAVAANEISKVHHFVNMIQQQASQKEGCSFKVAFYFVEALLARLTGSGVHQHKALKAVSANVYSKMFQNLPVLKCTHLFATEMILEQCKGAKRVHIVDYGIDRGFQWPSLIQAFAERPEGPPYLKITGIELSRLNSLQTGPNLMEYAKSCGVHLLYESIVSNSWETANPICKVNQDEVLVANCNLRMRHIQEDGITIVNPRRLLLERIHKMNPTVFVQTEMNANLCGPFFLPRFQEALRYYTASMEMTYSMNFPEELKPLFESMQASKIMNVVACEGMDRFERSMSYDNWDPRVRRAGFKQVPLSQTVYGKIENFLSQQNFELCSKLGMAQDKEWLLVGWNNIPLYAMCGWTPQ